MSTWGAVKMKDGACHAPVCLKVLGVNRMFNQDLQGHMRAQLGYSNFLAKKQLESTS